MVADLTPADFEVTEDGKPQTIEQLQAGQARRRRRARHLTARRAPIRTDDDEEREAARDDVRLFAIFLDDYHVRRAAACRCAIR